MLIYKANFWNKKIKINSKKHINIGVQLTELLNYVTFTVDVSKIIRNLEKMKLYKHELQLDPELPSDFILQYDNTVYKAQAIISKANAIARKFTLFKGVFYPEDSELPTLLNEFFVWKTPDDSDFESSKEDRDTYGFLNKTDFSYSSFELTKFVPKFQDKSFEIHEMERANIAISNLIDGYILFFEDILRVHYVYKDLINNYIHAKSRFLSENEISTTLNNYNKKSINSLHRYGKLKPSGQMQMEYSTMETGNGELALAETYTLDSLGSFLYLDFFHGLKTGSIPRKCENCGKYFLISNGRYSEFCENPLEDDEIKTCRDIGSRKKYDDKCKTDPVWLTYNRAYKAHYARYMKKKMTVSEFEQWSAYAIELREQMLNNKLEFEEYQKKIKK